MAERAISSERIFDGHLVALRVDEVELDDGRRSRREIVEHPGAVAILATDGDRVALVRQWRHAAGRDLLEIPAGTLEPGEDPRTTAERELAEECGLAARRWQEGPVFFTAPGFCTELMHLFLASDLVAASSIADADELIEVVWLPLTDALEAVETGEIADAKSIAGLGWLARQLAR